MPQQPTKRRITRAAAKAKGRRAVKWVIKRILYWFEELDEADVYKPAGSQPGEDVHLSPRARELLPISIEVKNQETLNIWAALKQAQANAPKGAHPVVFFQRAHSKMYVALEADTFLALAHLAWSRK